MTLSISDHSHPCGISWMKRGLRVEETEDAPGLERFKAEEEAGKVFIRREHKHMAQGGEGESMRKE